LLSILADIDELFENNREWASRLKQADPDFFVRLAAGHSPDHLWIGCSDSRVPANEIIGLPPGEIFVHRNVANLVFQTDLNLLSVLQFAVDQLAVEHVIVCGHYGCGGVRAAVDGTSHGLIDNWIRAVQEIAEQYHDEIVTLPAEERDDRLCELNVIQQVANVARTVVMQEAWERGAKVAVHGWIYGIDDGLLKNLDVSVTGPPPGYRAFRTRGL